MAVFSPRAGSSAHLPAPVDWHDPKEHIRKVAEVANLAQSGKINVTGTVTLTVSSATSTLIDERIGLDSAVLLLPSTANASAEFGNGTIYVTYPNATKGQATINHANNAQADRTFVYAVIG